MEEKMMLVMNPNLEELEKGFYNALFYGEEFYSCDKEGDIKCITEAELKKVIYGEDSNH